MPTRRPSTCTSATMRGRLPPTRGCCRPASRTRRPPSGASSEEAIRVAQQELDADVITIEAQAYAQGFYEKLGFVRTSDEFDDGGIMHVEMKLTR